MIEMYVANIATQMGIHLSQVSVVEGRKVGCINVHLLNLTADGQRVSTLVYQSELDDLENGIDNNKFEMKIQSALKKLQMVLEP